MSHLRDYYPTYWSGCNPIHKVRNWSYVRRLVRAAIRGEEIRPILIDGNLGNGSLLTGTHRAAANDLLLMLGRDECLIGYICFDAETASAELIDAVENCDYERIDALCDR